MFARAVTTCGTEPHDRRNHDQEQQKQQQPGHGGMVSEGLPVSRALAADSASGRRTPRTPEREADRGREEPSPVRTHERPGSRMADAALPGPHCPERGAPHPNDEPSGPFDVEQERIRAEPDEPSLRPAD